MKSCLPDIVVVFGLSGTGKSFVARILSEELEYVWLRSDVIRKELVGIDPYTEATAQFGKGIYTEEITRRVYQEMTKRAEKLVHSGSKVVLDATFLRKWQRDMIRSKFKKSLFILTTAPERIIAERLRQRKGDVSDANYSIYKKQKEIFEFPKEENYKVLDTDKDLETLRVLVKDLLKNCS